MHILQFLPFPWDFIIIPNESYNLFYNYMDEYSFNLLYFFLTSKTILRFDGKKFCGFQGFLYLCLHNNLKTNLEYEKTIRLDAGAAATDHVGAGVLEAI